MIAQKRAGLDVCIVVNDRFEPKPDNLLSETMATGGQFRTSNQAVSRMTLVGQSFTKRGGLTYLNAFQQ